MNQEHLQQSSTYSQRFSQLNQLLEQSAALWQVRAFEANALPWAQDFPQLAEAVWALADAELDGLDAEQSLLVKALSPALSLDLKALGQDWDLSLLTASIAERTVFNDKTVTDKAGVAEPLLADNTAAQQGGLSFDDEAHFSAHIKGRKWQQITAFVQHLPQLNLPVLEWCAGKGHLGRLIAKARGADVLSLEWQAQLCEAGQAFADKWQLSQTFFCADAFAIGAEHAATNTSITAVEHPSAANPLTTNPLSAQQQAVALHACGDLHVRLLMLAAEAGTQALAISPCCYHLIHASHYQPLSNLAQQSSLKLSRHDLQLPLQQSVIANPKQQALRHQEIAWRLGFDALQRACRQIDEYLPLPSLKQSQLSGSFADFCLWAAENKAVNLPQNSDFEAWLDVGRQRQQLTRRIDLVAHLFRTVLEQWLILDRSCFLLEQGYQVSMGEFCANSITPRNTLILALKSSD